jgi:hypothetical protein
MKESVFICMEPVRSADYYNMMQSFLIASSRAFLECHNNDDRSGSMLYGKSFLTVLNEMDTISLSNGNGY